MHQKNHAGLTLIVYLVLVLATGMLVVSRVSALDVAPSQQETIHTLRLIVIAAGALLAGFGMVVSLMNTRSVQRLIRTTAMNLDSVAGHLDDTSFQALLASQTLGDSITRQSSAITETTESLARIQEQAGQNATRAVDADRLITETADRIDQVDQSMLRLTRAMDDIRAASTETHHIISEINSIAMQTDILAMNAAVESVRAGDAGAGFGTIAEEVRALALTVTDAAHRTQALIENTVRKIQGGSELIDTTVTAYRDITERMVDSRKLIEEIAAASRGQAEHMSRMYDAVEHIDEVTGQNREHVEQTAVLSIATRETGEHMRRIIGALILHGTAGTGEVPQKLLSEGTAHLERLCSNHELRDTSETTHRLLLNTVLAAMGNRAEAVYSCRIDGTFIYSSPPAGIPSAQIRPWWQHAMAGDQYVSPVYISAITRKPCCTISMPFHTADGSNAGVVGLDLKIA